MTNPITSFLKELLRDKDKERLESMRETNAAIAATISRIEATNAAIAATVSQMEENNKELSLSVSRAVSALSKLKHRRSLLAGFQLAQNSPPDTNSSSSHNPVV